MAIVNAGTGYRRFLDDLSEGQIRYGVILLSDEFLSEPCDYIDDPYCTFIARNYVHPALDGHPKVLALGLGYRNGFVARQPRLPPDKRRYAWNFMGTVRDEPRRLALAAFSDCAPNFLHQTSHFNSSDYLDVETYAGVLTNSRFTLCPQGHINIDSFRFCEALEAGSIPVVLERARHFNARPTYWHRLFPGETELPFIVATDWQLARRQVDDLLQPAARDALRAKQEACCTFWQSWKRRWGDALHTMIGSVAGAANG
ncbi:MAG: exostosin family protein [Bauldia sp.]